MLAWRLAVENFGVEGGLVNILCNDPVSINQPVY